LVAADGSTTNASASNGALALKLYEFVPGSYNNPMMNSAANNNNFINIDVNGIPFGSAVNVDMNNLLNIQGLAAVGTNYYAVVQSQGIDVHNGLAFQPHVVPEPSSTALVLFAALALSFFARRFQRK